MRLNFNSLFLALGCFFVSLHGLSAQCNNCSVSSQSLDGCPDNGTFATGVFDLTEIVVGGGMTSNYYEDCSGLGNLTNEITGGDITSYSASDGAIIYVEEVNGLSMCVSIIEVTLNVFALSVDVTLMPLTGEFCAGGSVTLSANVLGGSGTIDYSWTTPAGGSPTAQTISGSVAGNYSVTASRNGCSVESNVETLQDESIVTSTDRTNVSCNGLADGTFSVTITGGSGQYDYVLSNGTTMNNQGSSATFTGLAPGNYHVDVTDDVGALCTVSSSASPLAITEPAAMGLTLEGVAPSMSGGTDGMIDVMVSGGNSPYDWERTGSGTTTGSSGSGDFSITDVGLAGGYSVTITDASGCIQTGSVTVPDAACNLGITGSVPTAPDCTNGGNGSVALSTENYSPPYTISWAGEEAGTSCCNSVDNATINSLSAGTYNLTVTDALGCSTSVSSVIVPNPLLISFSLSEAQSACGGGDNGSIQVSNITNGSGTYTINWTGPGPDGSIGPFTANNVQIPELLTGTYVIVITDSNGCSPVSQSQFVDEISSLNVTISGTENFCFDQGSELLTATGGFSQYEWSTGANSPTISIPNPGATNQTYSVTATDASGCTGNDVITVSRLAEISINLNVGGSTTETSSQIACDGRIDINVTGGQGPYTYLWSGPDSYTNTGEDIDNLCSGSYGVTITDEEGCIKTFSQIISSPSNINLSASSTDASCQGESDGSVTVDASSGTSPFTYLWMPGNQTSQTVTNLAAGTYTVTVTDSNDNSGTATAVVGEPSEVVGIVTPSNPEVCIGESITLNVSGGSSFTWSDNLGNNSELSVSPTTTSIYSVTVTDAATNNCTDVVSVTVIVNGLLSVTIDVAETSGLESNDNEICEGDQVTITASGGTSYNWSGGLSNPFAVSPASGTESYMVTVTDSNGCTDVEVVDITINENPTAVIDFSNSSQIIQDIQIIESNSIVNCGSLLECNWVVDGTAIPSVDCESIMPTFTTAGSKNVSLTVLNSCGCTEEVTNVLEIISADQCAVMKFTVNNGIGTACDGIFIDIETEEAASPDCLISTKQFEVFKDGILVTPGLEYDYSIDSIRFNSPGFYEMKYTIGDNCDCSKSSTRQIDIIPSPEISFLPGNPTSGCEGETVNIKFSGFDEGEKVTVEDSDGNAITYIEDNFDFLLGNPGNKTLTILSVENSVCMVEVLNESIQFDVIPQFEIISQMTNCAADGLSYSLVIETDGGEASASIIGDGISGTSSGADNYIIPDLDPNQEYSFTLERGDICEKIGVNLPLVVCDCGSAGTEHPSLATLLDFYDATNGASWGNNSGWIDGANGVNCDPCSGWFGIQCDENGNLVSIDLDGEEDFTDLPSLLGNNLQGNLTDIDISTLTYLNLAGNQLNGTLVDFAKIGAVKTLFLNSNNFEGDIPNFNNNLSLKALNLSNNNFRGTIPNLQNLVMLENIDLANNQLAGCFEDGFCDISFDFNGNFDLPWNGDYERYCQGEEQLGAFCGMDQLDFINSNNSDCACEEGCNKQLIIDSDSYPVFIDEEFSFSISENDNTGEDAIYEIISYPDAFFEYLALSDDGILEGSVNNYFIDTLEIEVEICVDLCSDCVSGFVYLINAELKDLVPTNVISPNGDGMNDFLRFSFQSKMEGSRLTVFNQWGNQVFSKNDYDNNWDAAGIPGGVYFYVFEYRGQVIKSALTILK